MTVKRFLIAAARRLLLAGGLVACLGLSALLTMRAILTSQEVAVPSLLGRAVVDAGPLLNQVQLQLKVEGRRYDAQVPAGRIVAQDPEGGATLKTRRNVRVWLSLGAQRLTVPAVEGQSVRSARLAFEQVSLPVEHVVEVDNPAPEGTVIAQRPPAGETNAIDGGVALLVSRGTGGLDYVMPDLIGRNAADVVEALRRAGLKVADVHYRGYAGVAPGIVLRQVPPAGHRVNARLPVSLDVSKAS